MVTRRFGWRNSILTAPFLGRDSLGCGMRSAVDQYGEDDKSKDDLGEAMGFKDKDCVVQK